MSVKLIKLTNGDEIFGEIVASGSNSISVNEPMIAESRRTQDGTSAMVIIRYIPFITEQAIVFQNKDVITITTLNASMTKYYYLSVKYASKQDSYMSKNVETACTYMEKVLRGDFDTEEQLDEQPGDQFGTEINDAVNQFYGSKSKLN